MDVSNPLIAQALAEAIAEVDRLFGPVKSEKKNRFAQARKPTRRPCPTALRISEERKSRRLSLRDAAVASGLTVESVRRIETAPDISKMSIGLVGKLCVGLGISLSILDQELYFGS